MSAGLSEQVRDAIRAVMARWKPPPKLNLSEWADRFFYLSPESSADPGKWHTLPYQRGIMDAMTDPLIEQVWVMKSARVGYTKMFMALLGYHIHQDPCPILVVQPTEGDAEGFSKEEIAPMIRDCDVLRDLVADPKARDSGNTILQKMFPGGTLSLAGANSPRGLRRISRRVVAFDEVDGYPPSAGPEGDQIKLGIRRTEYYWNRKIIGGSTPTVAGASRIAQKFEDGDQRRFYIACPHCDHKDYLVFTDAKNQRGHFMTWPEGEPEKAHFVCRECGGVIEHKDKVRLITEADQRQQAGEEGIGWVAEKPFKGVASFHVWAAYSFSPNATWGQIAAEFLEATREGPEALKTFVNTVLGEVWTDKGEAPDWERLYDRREAYPIGTVPQGGLFLTAGADVQGGQNPRIEVEVVAWGRGRRSWSVEYLVLPGDTSVPGEGAFRDLEGLLERRYRHANGAELTISVLAIDAGYNTQVVYDWVRRFPGNRVIAIQGQPKAKQLLGAPRAVDLNYGGKMMRRGARYWPVGVDIAKTELYGWLKLPRPSAEDLATGAEYPAGYCHFPEYPQEYFQQLTAEHLVPHKKKGGYIVLQWEQIPGRRNEALDCRVYARAAAASMHMDRFTDRDWERMEAELKAPEASEAERRAAVLGKPRVIKPRDDF